MVACICFMVGFSCSDEFILISISIYINSILCLRLMPYVKTPFSFICIISSCLVKKRINLDIGQSSMCDSSGNSLITKCLGVKKLPQEYLSLTSRLAERLQVWRPEETRFGWRYVVLRKPPPSFLFSRSWALPAIMNNKPNSCLLIKMLCRLYSWTRILCSYQCKKKMMYYYVL